MILLLNGSFGVGKTTVARALAQRIPHSIVFDPELIGIALQRGARLLGRNVDDFQDLRIWRVLTVAALRCTRLAVRNVIVPMAFSNLAYLNEIRAAFEPNIIHVCLVAPLETVHGRLRSRGADEWSFRRAAECCTAHASPQFSTHVDTTNRTIGDVVDDILQLWQPSSS